MAMEILYINSAVRSGSRTRQLAQHLLGKLGGNVTEVRPGELDMPAADEDFIGKRQQLAEAGDFSADFFAPARQFAKADIIVIAAPYWDLSFPAALKTYFEQINVLGLTFEYTPEGAPAGLCRAKKLYYVTTAGGYIGSDEYGFGYVRALAQTFYGIGEVRCFAAQGLDIVGSDADSILAAAKAEIDSCFSDN